MERSFQQSLTVWTSMTCSEAFSAFKNLYNEDQYFQIALTELLPTVQRTLGATDATSPKIQCARRILSLYLIYALYAPHPISLNPFHSFLSSVAEELSPQINRPKGDKILLRYLDIILANEGSTLDRLITGFLPELASIEIKPPNVPGAELATPGDTIPAASAALDASVSATQPLEDERMSRLLLDCQARVLSFSEQRYFSTALRSLPYNMLRNEIGPASIPKLASLNSRLCVPVIRRIFGDDDAHYATSLSHILTVLEPYFTSLSSLPPTLGSFDLIGSLLFEGEPIDASSRSATKDLVLVHVLPQFIGNCLQTIYALEYEQSTEATDTEGLYARTVQLLCKFVLSIMRRNPRVTRELSQDTVCVFSEGLDVELTNFALQNSRFSEANALYRALASRRTENEM